MWQVAVVGRWRSWWRPRPWWVRLLDGAVSLACVAAAVAVTAAVLPGVQVVRALWTVGLPVAVALTVAGRGRPSGRAAPWSPWEHLRVSAGASDAQMDAAERVARSDTAAADEQQSELALRVLRTRQQEARAGTSAVISAVLAVGCAVAALALSDWWWLWVVLAAADALDQGLAHHRLVSRCRQLTAPPPRLG